MSPLKQRIKYFLLGVPSKKRSRWVGDLPSAQETADFWLQRPLFWVLSLLALGAAALLFYYPVWHTDWQQDDVAAYFVGMTVTVDGQTMLDLNAVDRQGLQALPGIGETRAKAILDYRAANGPFTSMDQLLQVEGIGEKTLQTLQKYVTVQQNKE